MTDEEMRCKALEFSISCKASTDTVSAVLDRAAAFADFLQNAGERFKVSGGRGRRKSAESD